MDIIKRTVEEGQKSGDFRADIKAITIAKMFYGVLDEMVTDWILSKKAYQLAPMAKEVMKLLS